MSSEVWVTHPVFGEGKVEAEKCGGTHIKVRFKDGLVLWVSARRLRFVREGRKEKIDVISARRMIEAFRLGIVPIMDVEKFTYGREKERKVVERYIERLKNGKGGAILFEGEYGSGKTHLLEYVKFLALRKGFAVAVCSMDPEEVPPYRPKRVYRELVHSLTFVEDDEEKGFRDFLIKAEEMGLLKDHIFFGPFLKKLRRANDNEKEILWQWAEGESTKEYAIERASPFRLKGGYSIPALYDYSTAADLYCYMISGISNALREMGKAGLVILLDEGETVTHIDLKKYVERGWRFLAGLISISQNTKEARTIDTGFHNKLRPVPYLYRNAFILLVMAMTPLYLEPNYERLKKMVDVCMELFPLSSDSIIHLVFDLIHIYLAGYPQFKLSPVSERRVLNKVLSKGFSGMRDYLKGCVALLDEMRWSLRR